MKQTAVEWLEKQFVKLESTIGVHGVMYEIIEQAKEMEKEKIENAYQQGYNNAYFNNPISKDQYYNQTFKQD